MLERVARRALYHHHMVFVYVIYGPFNGLGRGRERDNSVVYQYPLEPQVPKASPGHAWPSLEEPIMPWDRAGGRNKTVV